MAAGADENDSFALLCWSGCPDDTYSYGSKEGGFFTSTLMNHWKPGISYEQLWKSISADESLKSAQYCQQTLLGGGWNFKKEAFK